MAHRKSPFSTPSKNCQLLNPQFFVTKYYSYKMVRDYGFAPNPFHGICTLATCKPHIRKKANIGDWIIGTGAKTTGLENRLIYTMQVTDKITFEEYWRAQRFILKKPLARGSLSRIHGDNIYFQNTDDAWQQLPSQHSRPDFTTNTEHMSNDLSGKYVLISEYFFYFGDQHFLIPERFRAVCSNIRDYYEIKATSIAQSFVEYVAENFPPGLIGDPIDWKEYTQRQLF